MDIERLEPGTKEWDAYFASHIVRYRFALKNISDSDKVLDVACGVGYGTSFLADGLKDLVYGVDINDKALRIANDRFSSDNTIFIQDDCESLTKIEGSFSHVVSFETFEHLKQPDKFLSKIYDLLTDEGTMIISTPNAAVTSPSREVSWKFHEQEYTISEFVDLVSKAGFEKIQVFGQHYSANGKIRNEYRKELNRLHHNPFIRLGKWLQFILKGKKSDYAILPETEDEFEIFQINDLHEIEKIGVAGPFVMIIKALKVTKDVP